MRRYLGPYPTEKYKVLSNYLNDTLSFVVRYEESKIFIQYAQGREWLTSDQKTVKKFCAVAHKHTNSASYTDTQFHGLR